MPEASIHSELDDSQLLRPEGFTPLHTIVAAAFQLFVLLAVCVAGLALALVYWPPDRKQCEPYFILLYVHAAFWCVSLVVHHHLHLKHEILRRNGYLDFHKLTRLHRRIPFHIVSLWNTILLVVTTIFHQANDHFEDQCKQAGLFNRPSTYLAMIVMAETLALTPFLSNYIVKVRRFNTARDLPDVLRDDLIASVDVGNMDADVREVLNVHDLLEKQADVIQFLRDHNARLSQKIVQLNAQQ